MKKEINPKGEAMPAVETTKEAKEVSILPKPEDIKKHLEEQIKKYNHLNKLVTDRDVFLQKKEELNKFLDILRSEKRGHNLDTELCKMVLAEGYRSEGIKITNAFIIEKTLRFIMSEIDEKVKILESDILTAN